MKKVLNMTVIGSILLAATLLSIVVCLFMSNGQWIARF